MSRYSTLLHGTEPPDLAAKFGVYAQLLRQREIHGDRLWKIEPMLYPLMLSAETDLHLATARLLEDPRRADGSVFTQGLDYSGARDGLALAGIDVTPEIWSQVRFIELGAKDALNGQ